MQEETQEYATEAKLRELVQKYSEFINFPIHLYDSKQIDVEVEEEEEAAEAADDSGSTSEEDEISDEGQSFDLLWTHQHCFKFNDRL